MLFSTRRYSCMHTYTGQEPICCSRYGSLPGTVFGSPWDCYGCKAVVKTSPVFLPKHKGRAWMIIRWTVLGGWRGSERSTRVRSEIPLRALMIYIYRTTSIPIVNLSSVYIASQESCLICERGAILIEAGVRFPG